MWGIFPVWFRMFVTCFTGTLLAGIAFAMAFQTDKVGAALLCVCCVLVSNPCFAFESTRCLQRRNAFSPLACLLLNQRHPLTSHPPCE